MTSKEWESGFFVFFSLIFYSPVLVAGGGKKTIQNKTSSSLTHNIQKCIERKMLKLRSIQTLKSHLFSWVSLKSWKSWRNYFQDFKLVVLKYNQVYIFLILYVNLTNSYTANKRWDILVVYLTAPSPLCMWPWWCIWTGSAYVYIHTFFLWMPVWAHSWNTHDFSMRFTNNTERQLRLCQAEEKFSMIL